MATSKFEKFITILFSLVILTFIGVIIFSIVAINKECDEPQAIITECPKAKVCPEQVECPYCPDWPGCPECPDQEACNTQLIEEAYENASIENETLMQEMSKVKSELYIVESALEVVCDSSPTHVLCN